MLAARQLEEVVYQRREPECDLFFQVVADNLETFLDRTRTDEHELPAHVEHELRRYTECGVLAHGLTANDDRTCSSARLYLAAAVRTSALFFASRGFSLHAATRIEAHDKAGLERLCRYVARPQQRSLSKAPSRLGGELRLEAK
jgi:hypothetical protein